MTRAAFQHAQWEPSRFYWAVLDDPGWSGRGPIPEGLLAALDEELPLPVEVLFPVAAPMSGGGLLVCAPRRSDLDELDSATLTLRPSHLPDFAAGRCDPESFNILVGPREPRPVRRTRARIHALASLTLLACAAILAVGLARRAEAWRTESKATTDAAAAASAIVLPDGGDPQTELVRLKELAAARPARSSINAAADLASVLAGWPAEAHATTQSIAIGQSGATLSLTVEGDPTAFIGAIRPPAGWEIDEPRLNTNDKVTRVTLRLRPREEPTP